MATEKRPKGVDIPVKITLKDANGAAIAPSTIFDYAVFVYSTKSIKTTYAPLLVFKKTPGAGEHEITVVDDVAGEIRIVIPRLWTKTAEAATLMAEIRTQTNASAEYESGKFTDGSTSIIICDLIDSSNPGALQ